MASKDASLLINGLQGLASVLRVRSAETAPQGLKPYAAVDDGSRADLLRARTRLLRLYRSLESLAEVANVNTRLKLDLPDAVSNTGLGLDMTHTAATLASSDEINTAPMSFTPFGPEWDGSSTAPITIGGEYDGTHGSGELFFEVRWAGTHGVDDVRIRVEDPEGRRIRNVTLRDNHPLDRQYDLRNGLWLQLGSGSLTDRDTTRIQVFDNVGAAVDPDKPLGGVRNDNPNLEYGMPAIVDGGFEINGQSINVGTTDSINDVVNRINQSAAGVTASFNAITERIEFLQDTLSSIPDIDLQNDTSNFLQATRLDSANTIAGIDPETIQTFDNVAAFSTVQSGNILINGQQIAIDTSNDSLDTVLDRINTSSAGVRASFDEATQKVTIEARDSSSRLDIDSNGTGFFGALNMPEGRVDPEAERRGISRRRSYDIADSLEAAFKELNYLFRDSSFTNLGGNSSAMRSPLESALRSALGGGDSLAALGLGYNNTTEARRRGDFAAVDRQSLTDNLQRRGKSVMNVLRGGEDSDGLVERLLIGTTQAIRSVNSLLGRSGTFVDTLA